MTGNHFGVVNVAVKTMLMGPRRAFSPVTHFWLVTVKSSRSSEGRGLVFQCILNNPMYIKQTEVYHIATSLTELNFEGDGIVMVKNNGELK